MRAMGESSMHVSFVRKRQRTGALQDAGARFGGYELFRDGLGDPEWQAMADLAQSVGGFAANERIAVVHSEDQSGNCIGVGLGQEPE